MATLSTNPRTGQTFVRRALRGNRTRRGPFGGSSDSGGGDVGSTSNAPIDDGGVEVPDGFEGGGSEGGVALPFDISGLFPEFTPVDFNPVDFPTINPAEYTFTDPQAFAKAFGAFNREELGKNFDLATDFSFKALQNELAGLRAFVPAAASLAREQTSIDNQFNTMIRGRQVDEALPSARGDLAAQRRRSLAYARGELPDSITDRALELGIRSRAADAAGFGGVGARSQQAEKLSDVMSAEERFQIAQYGENLFGQNLGTSASLFLPPTTYSQVGQQIRPTPEVGAGRLTYQGAGMINEATLLSPGAALESTIQQNQFKTNLTQRTNEFNATGLFNASTFNSQGALQAAEFNSSGAFTAGLGMFNYQAGLAGQLQSANQAQLNTALGLGLQGVQNDAAGGQFQAFQPSTLQSIGQGIGAIGGALQTTSQVLSSTGLTGGGGSSGGSSGGGGVGGGSVNTEPSGGSSTSQLPETELDSTFDFSPSQLSRGSDAAVPYTLKFADGVPTPAGYQRTGSNGDGTYSATSLQQYQSELDRFSRSSGMRPGSVTVSNAAQADRAVTNAAALSYVPIQGFRPVALSNSGSTVYSLPAAADSANFLKGAANVDNLSLVAAQLGVSSPEIEGTLLQLADDVSDPSFHQSLDGLALEKGDSAVAAAITNRLLGKAPNLETDAGQQFAFAAQRVGELWPNLSPEQKSMALTALTGSALELKTGKNLAEQTVPGTERSIAGPLKAADVMGITMQGLNGFSLARNWNQLSTISAIATDARGTRDIARVSDYAGLLGYGVQGSSVPVEPEYLNTVQAQPVPSLGVGTMIFKRPNLVPPHYSIVSQSPDGGTIAMPTNLMHTSPLNGGTPKPLAYKQARLVSQGKHPAQRLWGRSPSGRLTRGASGGSAIVSGLQTMASANPAVFSSVAAASLFGETLGEQIVRAGGPKKPFTGLTPEQIAQGEAIDPGFNIDPGDIKLTPGGTGPRAPISPGDKTEMLS